MSTRYDVFDVILPSGELIVGYGDVIEEDSGIEKLYIRTKELVYCPKCKDSHFEDKNLEIPSKLWNALMDKLMKVNLKTVKVCVKEDR